MSRASHLVIWAGLAMLFAVGSAGAQEQVFWSNVGGTGGGYVVGLYPISQDFPDNSYSIGFDFTVPQGPDFQFDEGEIQASLDSDMTGGSTNDMDLQIVGAGGVVDSATVSGLTDTPSLIQFNSTSNPILSAGQSYYLVASMVDPSATALWWTPAAPDPGTEIANLNGGPYTTAPLNRGAFALAGTPTQWQTTFSGSATIGGTGMQNAVMVCESFNASGAVLTKFVQPLGNFNANQATNYNFTQPLGVNAASAIYTILGTYGTGGVILGTTQSFGNTAVSNSSTFSSIFNGADEGTLYSELASGDYADIQNFFDTQLADFGGGAGSGGLPDIVLDGSDFQNMLADGGLSGAGGLPDVAGIDPLDQIAAATGGTADTPTEDFLSFSNAAEVGTGALTLSTTPEPSAAWMLLLLFPACVLRGRRPLARASPLGRRMPG